MRTGITRSSRAGVHAHHPAAGWWLGVRPATRHHSLRAEADLLRALQALDTTSHLLARALEMIDLQCRLPARVIQVLEDRVLRDEPVFVRREALLEELCEGGSEVD